MTSYQDIQNQLAQKAQSFGTRTADLPKAPDTANDPTLTALRGQHADKVAQLFKYDTERAQVTYNPGEAPGPHVEGYTPPTDRIIDPMIGARAASNQTQATAIELGDIMTQIAQRKDLLADTYQKGLDVYNAGIEAQKLEFDALNKIFSNAFEMKKYETDLAESKKKTEGELSMEDFMKLMYGEEESAPTTPDPMSPQYTPANPNVTVEHNGALWKYDKTAGKWNQVGESELTPPSYFTPD